MIVQNFALSIHRMVGICLKGYHLDYHYHKIYFKEPTFKDIEKVEIVVSDLLIWSENEEQHDTRLIEYIHFHSDPKIILKYHCT